MDQLKLGITIPRFNTKRDTSARERRFAACAVLVTRVCAAWSDNQLTLLSLSSRA
jgi:hypothetical protein